ncbi:MAG TPA: hypothetical protein V6C96_01120 [Vampirovibrionales bacterium]
MAKQTLKRQAFSRAYLYLGIVPASFVLSSQLFSKGLIFSDPNSGSNKFFTSTNSVIKHQDYDKEFVFFPHQLEPNRKYIVTFGVAIDWKHAQKGAQILANISGSEVELVHNGSVNRFIDYLRGALNRLHIPLLGRGNEKAINKLEERILSNLLQSPNETLVLVGHSAGASTIAAAIRKIIKEHPEFLNKLQESVQVEFWGSPEFRKEMRKFPCEQIRVYNRNGDYIAEAFEGPLLGGLALPLSIFKLVSALVKNGNQHRIILYLADYMSYLNRKVTL